MGGNWDRFVAIGDSFVEGLEDDKPDLRHLGWADRVASALAEVNPRQCYANLALRGKRLPQIVTEQLPAALALRPNLVCLEGGGNDVLRPKSWDCDAISLMLEFGIRQIRETGADVLMIAYRDPSIRWRTISTIGRRVCQLNEATLSLGEKYGCIVADASGAVVLDDRRLWSADRLHLNAIGHERIARSVLDALGVVSDPFWGDPLPADYRVDRVTLIRSDLEWTREHLAPWVGRRVMRRPSHLGIEPKRPQMSRVRPSTELARIHLDVAS
jgi:lysophospholipase L1-like esterase